MITLCHTVRDLREALEPKAARRAVVMTMGALHAGHLALVRRARELADDVVVTVFVNPLQFGPHEDFAAYPRTLPADVAALEPLGPLTVFAPSGEQMYPLGTPAVSVTVGGSLATTFEGAIRPGHFGGVATVVTKLLGLTRPDVALFGQKDAQQLAVIRAMVRDLNLGVQIEAVPIVRDEDGLALSSRNAYLTALGRERALALPRAIAAGLDAQQAGADPAEVVRVGREVLAGATGVEMDYLSVVDERTFAVMDAWELGGSPVLIGAIRVESVRLLDNAPLMRNGSSHSG